MRKSGRKKDLLLRMVLGCDHAGFALKQEIAAYLREHGCAVHDVGTNGTEPVDYPDFAEAVGMPVREGKADRGIVICGSGIGASIAANKIPGIRAAVCHDTYSARQGVEHDDMNVLVMGSRVIGPALAHEIVATFLKAKFSGEERHRRRLGKVLALEAKYANPAKASRRG
jgi:RpiB/LacA/LacB family sugar-phosphate isomerase